MRDFRRDREENKAASGNGDYLTVAGTIYSRFPAWTEGFTLFRPFGCPTHYITDPEARQALGPAAAAAVAPTRYPLSPDFITPWLSDLPQVVRGAGTERMVTFFNRPKDLEDGAETPYELLNRVVKTAAKSDPSYKAMLQGQKGKGSPVPRIFSFTGIQGLMLIHGKNDFTQNPRPTLLVLPKTADDSLMALLEVKDAAGNYAMDVVRSVGGKLLKIAPSDKVDVDVSKISFNNGPGKAAAGGDKKDDENRQSYKVELLDSIDLPDEWVLQNFIPWEKLFYKMSVAEQVSVLCTAFTGQVIAKVFRDSRYEELVPKIIRDRYFVSGGGYATPAAYAQQAPVTAFVPNLQTLTPPAREVPQIHMPPAQAPVPPAATTASPPPQPTTAISFGTPVRETVPPDQQPVQPTSGTTNSMSRLAAVQDLLKQAGTPPQQKAG